ncbi:cell division protein FtsA [Gammaproteobacteria bacterium]|nr:cell division protein FtsA [Gammaproteobacteria bacterium]
MFDVDGDDVRIKVALDVGTAKVRVVIGAVQLNGDIQILGHGEAPSKGLRKGMVTNIEHTINAIAAAKAEAETNSEFEINTVSAIISGSQITTYHSSGAIKIAGDSVTLNDINEVMETATALALPPNQEIIHAFAKEYVIDGQREIRDPLDLSGVRLEAHVYLLACEKTITANLTKCIEALHINIDSLVLQSISASAAVLSEEEKENGVCLVNIGAGTTDVAIFYKGALCYTSILPIAGETVTSDISKMQRISTPLAETIKINYGACSQKSINIDEMVELPQANSVSKRLSRQALVQVIEARYEEIFEMVQIEIERSGCNHLLSSIVLTGGGSLISGLTDFAEEIFHLDARIGIPSGIRGGSPILSRPEYATALGLLLDIQKDDYHGRKKIESSLGLFGRIKNFSKKYF